MEIGDLGEQIIAGFQVSNLDESGIEIKLAFKDAMRVSIGVNPDLLFFQLDLSDFRDENAKNLQE